MLIERMHTNPEDFEYGGKLHGIVNDRDLSERDHTAIVRATEELVKEPKLMEKVITALLAQPEQEETAYKTYGQARMSINSSGQLGIGTTPSNYAQGLYASGFSDPRLAQGSPGFAIHELQPHKASLQVGQQTLTESTIKAIKQKLGL